MSESILSVMKIRVRRRDIYYHLINPPVVDYF